MTRAPATAALVTAILAFFAIETFVSYGLGLSRRGADVWRATESEPVLLATGALYPQMSFASESWRLLAAVFVHIGFLHLLFNITALAQFGYLLEGLFGRWRLLVSFFASGLLASAGSVMYMRWTAADSLSAGASGAVFGLLATLAIMLRRSRDLKWKSWSQRVSEQLFGCAFINLAIGFAWAGWVRVFGGAVSIDNAAHISGLLVGSVVGLVGSADRLNPEAERIVNQFDSAERRRREKRAIRDHVDMD